MGCWWWYCYICVEEKFCLVGKVKRYGLIFFSDIYCNNGICSEGLWIGILLIDVVFIGCNGKIVFIFGIWLGCKWSW